MNAVRLHSKNTWVSVTRNVVNFLQTWQIEGSDWPSSGSYSKSCWLISGSLLTRNGVWPQWNLFRVKFDPGVFLVQVSNLFYYRFRFREALQIKQICLFIYILYIILFSSVEEWISLDSNSSRVKIHYSITSGISAGSLDIHSKRSDHWRHYPGSDVSDK